MRVVLSGDAIHIEAGLVVRRGGLFAAVVVIVVPVAHFCFPSVFRLMMTLRNALRRDSTVRASS